MRNRNIFGYMVLALAALTAAVLLWYIYFVPYTLKVAVGPSNSEPTALLAAMSAAIERDNASVRLVLVPFANLAKTLRHSTRVKLISRSYARTSACQSLVWA